MYVYIIPLCFINQKGILYEEKPEILQILSPNTRKEFWWFICELNKRNICQKLYTNLNWVKVCEMNMGWQISFDFISIGCGLSLQAVIFCC